MQYIKVFFLDMMGEPLFSADMKEAPVEGDMIVAKGSRYQVGESSRIWSIVCGAVASVTIHVRDIGPPPKGDE